MPSVNFSIDLPVRSEWANVDLLRTSLESCFTTMFTDPDGCRSLAMVTGELVENAIKYGDWSCASDHRFRLRVWGEGRSAHVLVENPVQHASGNAAEVLRTLGWMRGFGSPIEAYRARLLEVAAAGASSGDSKLGLVRIAYEGNCLLTAELIRGVLYVEADLTV
ncbi:MAG TPA: hypothetical protein VFK02_28040 [Kofleriaceae bacterium]|nr:hypothetical protein [Kofleriaceae bacterium]